MPVGFQVKNANGHFQIDDTWRNPMLQQKLTYTTAGDHTFTVNFLVAPLVLFWSDHTDGICLKKITKGAGNTLTYLINGIGEVFIFDFVNTSPPGGHYGLQVRRADGTIAFDSNFEVLKPVAISHRIKARTYIFPHTVPLVDPNNSSTQYTPESVPYADPPVPPTTPLIVPVGKKWAWHHHGNIRWYWYDFDTGYYPGFPDGINKGVFAPYQSGQNIKFTYRRLGYVGGGEYYPGIPHWHYPQFTFFDVTGM